MVLCALGVLCGPWLSGCAKEIEMGGKAYDPAAVEVYPWTPDQGDGTYRNPVLLADYSDPDVIRVGEDYYLTGSSFQCTPALPILHSRDLVNWTIIGHALERIPLPRYDIPQPGSGVWAPALRYHNGRYYIFFSLVDEGIFVTSASDPTGPWSEIRCVQEGAGLIDPCPLWDDDGRAYLVHAYAFSRTGIKHRLRVCPMAPDGSRLLGEGKVVFEDPQHQPGMEGPKFLKKDGYYYILAPAGGVGNGWQAALRSRDIYGPYEDKIVLHQGNSPVNGPHQGALVDTPGGQWWFLHFSDAGPYGRIVHLQPVRWEDGWPLIGQDANADGIGEPVLRWKKPDVGRQYPVAIPQTSDEFDGDGLGLQWQWQANGRPQWYSLSARPGWLRLTAQPVEAGDFAEAGNLLLQKLPARAFAVQTTLELAATGAVRAGLIVMGREHAALALRPRGQGAELVMLVNGAAVFSTQLAAPSAALAVEVADGGLCRFAYAQRDGEPLQPVGAAFQAVKGYWIGANVGLFCISDDGRGTGQADFDYFRFSPPSGL
jgi:beta-xylosidase